MLSTEGVGTSQSWLRDGIVGTGARGAAAHAAEEAGVSAEMGFTVRAPALTGSRRKGDLGVAGTGLVRLCLLALMAGGCSGVSPMVPAQPMESYAFRQTQAGVRVAVDPFFTVERTREAFTGGEEFPEKGLLPVQVVIENGSSEEIQVSPREFRLARQDGRAEGALLPDEAFAMVKLPVGWWGLGAGFVGGSVPAYRNEARQRDIESRELREATIPGGRSATGFVYFAIPENAPDLAGRRVVFPIQGPGGRELIYDVPIAGRRDIPGPAQSAGTARTPPPSPAAPGQASPQGPIRIEGTGGGVIIRSPSQ